MLFCEHAMIKTVIERIKRARSHTIIDRLSVDEMRSAPLLCSRDVEYGLKADDAGVQDIIRLSDGGFARIKVSYGSQRVYTQVNKGRIENVRLSPPVARVDTHFDAEGIAISDHYSAGGTYSPHALLLVSRQVK